jgi:hypothetical protein
MSQTPTPEPTRPNSESIKALIVEAVNDLQRDQLKIELLERIRSKKEKISFRTLASHPAFLLFIGFIFTGIIGTFITSKWQRNEWDRQQARLVHIRRIDQKEKVMEELVQTVADSNATEEDVLNAFSKDWRQGDPRREDITEERLEAWQKQGGRDWRIATEMIQSKLNFYFTRKDELLTIFNGILGRRANDIVPAIYGLKADYIRDKNIRADPSFIARIAQIRPEIDENRKDLQQMLAIILGEIQREVEST